MAFGGHDGFGVELESVDGIVSVFDRHDFAVFCAGGDFKAFGHRAFYGCQGVVAGGFDFFVHSFEEGAFGIEGNGEGFAMNQFFGIGDGGAEAFADGLMSQAYAKNRDFRRKVSDGIDGDACVFGPSGAGGDEDGFGFHFFQFFHGIGVVPDDSDIGIEASCKLV